MGSQPLNPIIPGFAPDPSVTLVGDTFVLVNSTFHIFPGLPVYASKDLVNWVQIGRFGTSCATCSSPSNCIPGNAINRPSQLSLRRSDTVLLPSADGTTMPATGGLYAPTIRHHAARGKTYIVCTNVVGPENVEDFKRLGMSSIKRENFIISTSDIWADNWSDPMSFEFQGIDPSISWDEDGRTYICGSAGSGPNTTIDMFEVDLSTGEKLSAVRTIWKGTGGAYPEGPHIYSKDGWKFLVIAEGGTWRNHMVSIARSKSIWGPYEAYAGNPILTARGTGEYVQCTGHMDLFQDLNGSWWGACLGIRTRRNAFLMGRETFLTSVRWEEEQWPVVQQVAIDRVPSHADNFQSGEFVAASIRPRPGVGWVYIRTPDTTHYNLDDAMPGSIIMLTPSQTDITKTRNPVTFIGKRQRKLTGASSVILKTPLPNTDISAGLVLYKDEFRFTRIYFHAKTDPEIVFEVVNQAQGVDKKETRSVAILSQSDRIVLQIEYTEQELCLSCRSRMDSSGQNDDTYGSWRVGTEILSDRDFVGPVIGVYATGNNLNGDGLSSNSKHQVVFRDFQVD